MNENRLEEIRKAVETYDEDEDFGITVESVAYLLAYIDRQREEIAGEVEKTIETLKENGFSDHNFETASALVCVDTVVEEISALVARLREGKG